jgi:small subunit ribosomal protein S4e
MSKSMKRLTAPRSWPVPRKTDQWITKPSPGPHPIQRSMPVLTVVRDLLQACDTAAEAKRIIGNRDIIVDGRPVREHKFPVGLMDVVSIPKLEQNYRMLVDRRGKFRLVTIREGEESWKLCRIENKTTVRGGRIQLNLHDGRNIIVKENKYKTGDVLKVEVPSQKILEVYPMAKGNIAMVISGAHAGEISVIEEYEVSRTPSSNVIRFRDGKSTVKDNVFVVGTSAPVIELPEASVI